VAGLSSLAPLARPKKGGSSSGLGSALGLGSVREQLQGICRPSSHPYYSSSEITPNSRLEQRLD
jgi:hypothetical protein